jgi:subtilisin-like proprotein convertase family protein
MKSTKILAVACAAALAASAVRAQFNHSYWANTSLAVPPSGTGGASGGVSNPANATSFSIEVPIAVVMTKVVIGTYLSHTKIGDLRIDISHCDTTVSLYDQFPSTNGDLSGTYTFDDAAVTSFASAIYAAGSNGVVAPGTYAPLTPLSAFNGTSSAGTWTITVYDLLPQGQGGLFNLAVTVIGYEAYQSDSLWLPITNGLSGQCLSPVVRVINVPTHGVIADTSVHVNMAHTWISDLDITIQHAGVSVALSQYNTPASGADVNGIYGFWDGAANAWTTAETSFAASTIPAITYRPAQPLAAFAGLDQYGPWYFTVCDRAAADTGVLGTVFLSMSRSPYELVLSQPNGSASIKLVNQGGVPGDSFVNLFTLAQGTAPYGWVAGLDISVADVVSQLSFGAPFTGMLGPCGATAVTVNGPIPSGLTVWGASFELDVAMVPVATKRVFSYTTQ